MLPPWAVPLQELLEHLASLRAYMELPLACLLPSELLGPPQTLGGFFRASAP